ncbi:hypothetical protein EV197_1802 [Aquimarina brevivitae]|uniref:Uncharacterized protein n=2 Tax=Aquimarina brevivitae TaxID=323412 RepID=A0A4Q7P100_9FLAO|nr:hypothetical protein EV197_1802 [Aquimarina brevivitae]
MYLDQKSVMNTKILMMATAVYLGLTGLALTFLPQEIAQNLNSNSDQVTRLLLQVLGALYLGFAMLNWMAKNNLIGGIYSKPLVVGNLAHYVISSFALVKVVHQFSGDVFSIMIGITVVYIIFSLCFAYVYIANPTKLTVNK